jgi:hypothetical protein
MTVLTTLQSEPQQNKQIEDRIKYKITPTIINHTQVLDDCFIILERHLFQLAIRLGRTIPSQWQTEGFNNDDTDSDNITNINSSQNGKIINHISLILNNNTATNITEVDAAFNKIEYETRRVSDTVQKLQITNGKLRQLDDDSGERACYTAIHD